MPRVLEHLEPKAVFHFFEDLTRIPHGSRNTKAISDYCAAFAEGARPVGVSGRTQQRHHQKAGQRGL